MITESIFDGKNVIVPLADVQHIEKRELGIKVITNKTKWDYSMSCWENNIWIGNEDHQAQEFLSAWCRYRYELERLEAQLAASQHRERAAVGDLSTYKDCGFCVHIQDQQYCYKNCQRHVDVDNFRTHPCWQWRGPQAGKGAK